MKAAAVQIGPVLYSRQGTVGKVGEIFYPTQRRIYVTGRDNRPLLERVVLSIEVHDIEMAWSGGNIP